MVFGKSLKLIQNEIESLNNIKTLQVKKFIKQDNTKYLVIITESAQTTLKILSRGYINVFGDKISPEQRSHRLPQPSHHNGASRVFTRSAGQNTGANRLGLAPPAKVAPPKLSRPSSGQHQQQQTLQRPSLPARSNWAGPRKGLQQQPRPSNLTTLKPRVSQSEHRTRPTPAPRTKKSSLAPSLPTTRPSDDQAINAGPPRGQQLRLESSEPYPDRHHQQKHLLEATSIVCSKLSEGLENPDLYLIMFNKALKYQGYLCPVKVPKEILQFSKTIYNEKYCKQHITTSPPSHPTSTPSNPHPLLSPCSLSLHLQILQPHPLTHPLSHLLTVTNSSNPLPCFPLTSLKSHLTPFPSPPNLPLHYLSLPSPSHLLVPPLLNPLHQLPL